MRTVQPASSSNPLQETVAACLASILELDVAEVPVPEAGHPEPWVVWKNWLSQRGLGLVPVAEPRRFNWPGPWIALLPAPDGQGQVGAVAFGSPPGLAWVPSGGEVAFEAVERGFVIAPADVALWAPPAIEGARSSGSVEAVMVAPEAKGAMARVGRAVVIAGRGLEGDRYFDGRGTFSQAHDRGHDLTLIEAEVLDDLGLAPEGARRNLVTRGVDLNALVGRHFTVGGVRCFGQRLCEPCAHLERLTPGTLRPLIHRGGLRADVLTDGEIGAGDAVAAG